MMNDELKKIVIASGAPSEMVNQLWFNLFCMKFANELLTLAEEVVSE